MRELEKYYCEYIILGLPKKTFFFLLRLRLQKGGCPTLYTENIPLVLRIFKTARIIQISGMGNDRILLEALERHLNCLASKKAILIYSHRFSGFIKRNNEQLEKRFLIYDSEEIYEA